MMYSNSLDYNDINRISSIVTSSTYSSNMTNEEYREEQIYIFVLRCCLYPLENKISDLNCTERITTRFKSYIYNKKMNSTTKYPKYANAEGISKLSKCVFNICIMDFYKLFQTSGMFKDYLIFYVHLVNMQMKMLQVKFSLNDENYDKIFLECVDFFVAFFKEFISKQMPEINIQKCDIFERTKYISILSNSLKSSSKIVNESGNLPDWVRIIFDMDINNHNLTISSIKKVINKKTSNVKTLMDFKKYLSLIEENKYPYSLKTDFYSSELYEMWKKNEKAQIVKEITTLQKYISSENLSMSNTQNFDEFYFIPPDPYSAFKKVVELCMYKDCSDNSMNTSEIFSNNSKDIISECETRWRISSVYKEIIILDILIQNFLNNYIGVEDILDYCESFIEKINEKGSLRVKETNYFCKILSDLNERLMNDISHIFQIMEDTSQIQIYLTNIVNVLKFINENKIYQTNKLRNNIKVNYLKEIQEKLKIAIKVYYNNMEQNIFASGEDEVTKIMKYFASLKNLVNEFQIVVHAKKNSSFNFINIVSEVCYLSTLKYLPKQENIENIEDYFNDLFEIYKFVKFLHEKSNVKVSFAEVENWFKVFVEKWIMSTDESINKRIESIIKFEKYEPINIDQKIYYSDSVIDLFRHFDLVLSSMNQIEWTKITDKALFMKKYIKILNKLIKEYIIKMDFDLDMVLFNSRDVEELYKLIDKKSEEIRSSPSFISSIKIFNSTTFVKLNNIFETYDLLDKLCSNSEIPYYHNILESQSNEQAKLVRKDSVIGETEQYRIKLINVEGLHSLYSGSISSYILIMLNNDKVYKSRVVEKSINPEFNEEFTLNLPDTAPSVFNIVIKNKNSEVKNTVIGTTKVMLRNILFEDGLTHNLQIPINSQCTLNIRICKIKETDDIKYWTLNISEKLEFLIEDSCRSIIKMISKTVINYIDTIIESNKSFEILETEHQMIPLFEYLNKALLEINTYLDININKYLAEHFDEPFLKKYLKKIKKTNVENKNDEKRMSASKEKLKRAFTRAQTLINIVRNKENPEIKPRNYRNGLNDELDEDEFNEDGSNIPSHDFIKLIWKSIIDELYSLMLQNYDQYGNSIKEKSKGKGRFFNNFQQFLGTGFNKKSIDIVNNSLELLKSFFACEIDNTCYGFSKEELEIENYQKLKGLIKLCKEKRN